MTNINMRGYYMIIVGNFTNELEVEEARSIAKVFSYMKRIRELSHHLKD